jgi:hypothetical protein
MALKIMERFYRWLEVLNSLSFFLTLLLMVCGGMFLVVNALSHLFASGTFPGAVALVVTVSVFSVLYGTIAGRILAALGVGLSKKIEV